MNFLNVPTGRMIWLHTVKQCVDEKKYEVLQQNCLRS